jgi:hypothetical protein
MTTYRLQKLGDAVMRAVPPEGPLHRHDRAREPDWLDQSRTEPALDHAGDRHRAAIPTILLIAAVILIVALIFLL